MKFLTARVFALIAAGCPAWGKKFTLDSVPVKQGRIFIDDRYVGIAPVTVDLKVSGKMVIKARAGKEGAVGFWITEFTKDQNQTVFVRLEEDEASTQTVAYDIANKWQTIDPSATGGSGKVIDEGEAWKCGMGSSVKRGVTPDLTIRVEILRDRF